MKNKILLIILLMLNLNAAKHHKMGMFEKGLKFANLGFYDVAMTYWEKLAEFGHTKSQYALAVVHYEGLNGLKDIRKAMYYYKKAADGKNKYAQYNLGVIYQNGDSIIKKSEIKAKKYYELSAKNGCMEAQYNLALMYFNGEGGYQDYIQSAHWFEKAAKNGDESAMFNLGVHYRDGLGVDANLTKAIELFEEASDKGSLEATSSLGYIYKYGFKDLMINYDKAYFYYKKAYDMGDNNSLKELDYICDISPKNCISKKD